MWHLNLREIRNLETVKPRPFLIMGHFTLRLKVANMEMMQMMIMRVAIVEFLVFVCLGLIPIKVLMEVRVVHETTIMQVLFLVVMGRKVKGHRQKEAGVEVPLARDIRPLELTCSIQQLLIKIWKVVMVMVMEEMEEQRLLPYITMDMRARDSVAAVVEQSRYPRLLIMEDKEPRGVSGLSTSRLRKSLQRIRHVPMLMAR